MAFTKDSELVQVLHRATICDHCSADAIAGMLNNYFAAPPREWPADAPDWAMILVENKHGTMLFYGFSARLTDWSPIGAQYTGPRPASWTGLDWTKCVLRRPGGGK